MSKPTVYDFIDRISKTPSDQITSEDKIKISRAIDVLSKKTNNDNKNIVAILKKNLLKYH